MNNENLSDKKYDWYDIKSHKQDLYKVILYIEVRIFLVCFWKKLRSIEEAHSELQYGFHNLKI